LGLAQDFDRGDVAEKSGRGGGIRTPDILLPKQARYQTALHPEKREVIITSRAASLQGFEPSGQLQKSTFADI
jgi:hypothetical protein